MRLNKICACKAVNSFCLLVILLSTPGQQLLVYVCIGFLLSYTQQWTQSITLNIPARPPVYSKTGLSASTLFAMMYGFRSTHGLNLPVHQAIYARPPTEYSMGFRPTQLEEEHKFRTTVSFRTEVHFRSENNADKNTNANIHNTLEFKSIKHFL